MSAPQTASGLCTRYLFKAAFAPATVRRVAIEAPAPLFGEDEADGGDSDKDPGAESAPPKEDVDGPAATAAAPRA